MGTWTSNSDKTEVYYTYTYDMSDDGVDNPTEFKDVFKYDDTEENNIGTWIRSEWSNSTDGTSGSYSSTTADDGSYVTTETWSDGTNTSIWTYSYNSEGIFTGGTSDNGETTIIYDSNWNIVSQTADTTGLATLTADDGMAYTLFGAAKYAETGNWSDDWGTSTEYTYYDANGNKLGTSNTSTYSWDDGNGNTIHSTNTSYNTIDADGNWQFLGSEWSDDQGNSGSNTTSIVDGTSIDLNNDGNADYSGTDNVRMDTGTNTWTWDGKTETSTYTWYYEDGTDVDGNGNTWDFLGGTEVRNGETTTYDSNWNIVGTSTDTSNLTEVTDTTSMAYQLFDDGDSSTALYTKQTNSWSDDNGNTSVEYSYYDASGNKLGTSNTSTYSWNDGNGNIIQSTSTSYNTIDADGNYQFLGSEWSDDQGNSGTSVNTYDSESNTLPPI